MSSGQVIAEEDLHGEFYSTSAKCLSASLTAFELPNDNFLHLIGRSKEHYLCDKIE